MCSSLSLRPPPAISWPTSASGVQVQHWNCHCGYSLCLSIATHYSHHRVHYTEKADSDSWLNLAGYGRLITDESEAVIQPNPLESNATQCPSQIANSCWRLPHSDCQCSFAVDAGTPLPGPHSRISRSASLQLPSFCLHPWRVARVRFPLTRVLLISAVNTG